VSRSDAFYEGTNRALKQHNVKRVHNTIVLSLSLSIYLSTVRLSNLSASLLLPCFKKRCTRFGDVLADVRWWVFEIFKNLSRSPLLSLAMTGYKLPCRHTCIQNRFLPCKIHAQSMSDTLITSQEFFPKGIKPTFKNGNAHIFQKLGKKVQIV
jgi:hypothetical protein